MLFIPVNIIAEKLGNGVLTEIWEVLFHIKLAIHLHVIASHFPIIVGSCSWIQSPPFLDKTASGQLKKKKRNRFASNFYALKFICRVTTGATTVVFMDCPQLKI